jgi:hypothetical protein
MLLESDALRVEYETVVEKRGSYQRPIYIFRCYSCGKEMRKQRSSLSRHSGFCVRCVKRNRHPLRTVYSSMRSSCLRENKRSGRDCPFDLTFEEFLVHTQVSCCTYCGGGVKWVKYRNGPSNIDRKDSSKGYSADNTVVCCGTCNRMKSNWYSFEEFVAISRLLREWISGRMSPMDI